MKKLFGILMVMFAIQAQARSIMPSVLEYQNLSKLAGGKTHELNVYASGAVVHRERAAYPGGNTSREVTVLTADQMDRIYNLVQKTTPVRMGFEVTPARCFQPSTHTLKYTAGMQSIFLREGAICDGGFKVNKRAAAKTLVAVLDVLERAAHNPLRKAQLEKEIDLILE